jgi:tRNA-dihydrouridine synthase B
LEGRSFQPPVGGDQTNLMIEHYEAMLSFYGVDLGVRVSRKHLGWWLERMPGGAVVRQKVMRMTDPGDVFDALRSDALNEDRVAA